MEEEELVLQIKDEAGEEHSYRILTVFEVGSRKQQYIALIPTEPNNGNEFEIELYRCKEEGEGIIIDNIRSDMEMQEVKQEFEKLLDDEIQ